MNHLWFGQFDQIEEGRQRTKGTMIFTQVRGQVIIRGQHTHSGGGASSVDISGNDSGISIF